MATRTIGIGSYVNFTVQRVLTAPSGSRGYVQQKYLGKVVSIVHRDLGTLYKIKVRNSQEYHEVSHFKITHVWYIV